MTLAAASGLQALDYRSAKPQAWTAHEVAPAIKALYGEIDMEKSDAITIKTPKVASSGATIPLRIKSDLHLKSLAVFQDANPESAVAVFTVNPRSVVDYSMNIKMAKSGTISVVAEGIDGKYYTVSQSLKVAEGGCEG